LTQKSSTFDRTSLLDSAVALAVSMDGGTASLVKSQISAGSSISAQAIDFIALVPAVEAPKPHMSLYANRERRVRDEEKDKGDEGSEGNAGGESARLRLLLATEPGTTLDFAEASLIAASRKHYPPVPTTRRTSAYHIWLGDTAISGMGYGTCRS